MVTADLAISYSREVFTFPGRTYDLNSKGCNNLIRANKAALITSADDLIESLGWNTRYEKKAESQQTELFFAATPEQEKVLQLLKTEGEKHINEIALRLSMPIQQLSTTAFRVGNERLGENPPRQCLPPQELIRAEAIADERYPPAVRRPGIDVNRPLSAEETDQGTRLTAFSRHDAQLDMLVRQVLVGFQVVFLIGYEDDLLAIGGNMREPRVACLVECHLRLLAPVCLHAPYLHQPAADGIEPDYWPQGEYSGPSSRPSAVVSRTSSPPSAGIT